MDSDVEMAQEINTKDLDMNVNYNAVRLAKANERVLRLSKNEYSVRHIKGESKKDCVHLAASTSDKVIHVLDATTFCQKLTLKGHTNDITDLTFGKLDIGGSTIYSSSIDGTIRCWDLRTSKQVLSFQDDSSGKLKPILTCDVNCDESFICGGSELVDQDVFILLWDKRKPNLLNSFSDSHQDDITQARFHPETKTTMASGSVDGLINIFNVSEQSDDDAILTTCNTESSVDQLCWFQNDQGKYENLALLTHTETVQLWNTDEVSPYKTLSREQLATTFKTSVNVNSLVSCFPSREQETITVIASSPVGHGFLIDINKTEVKARGILQGLYSTHIDCAYFDVHNENAVTADEEGNLVLWKASRASIAPKRKGDTTNVKSKKKKRT